MNGVPVLSVEHLVKEFPLRSPVMRREIGSVHAVDDATLRVFPGETVGLVGESGSGKSTLGRLSLRLIEPTSGLIKVDGRDITLLPLRHLKWVRRKLQMIFQDPRSSFDPHATLADSIGEPLFTHLGMRRARRDQRAGELLEQVGLHRSMLSRYPHEFSGGQLQRLALARALALDPRLIVADEPLSSLDASTQAEILRLLESLQRDLGVAYLFISHDLSVIERISSRIAVMYLGRIVESGDTKAVATDPKHPYTQALWSAVPVADPVAQRRRHRILLAGDPPSPANLPSGCRFHTRCQYVMDVCRVVDPPATFTADGTTVYCHLHIEEASVEGDQAVTIGSSTAGLRSARRGVGDG